MAGGVSIATVPAAHSNGVAGALIGGELGDMLDAAGLTAYAGPPTGYVLTFSNGLAVYHCDTMGSNEWQGGTADRHYQCALIQADGSRHLENNRNRGDSGDLFGKVGEVALSAGTVPSSKAWGGSDSGLVLSGIGEPGSRIPFTAGTPEGDRVAVDGSLIVLDTATGVVLAEAVDGRARYLDASADGGATSRLCTKIRGSRGP